MLLLLLLLSLVVVVVVVVTEQVAVVVVVYKILSWTGKYNLGPGPLNASWEPGPGLGTKQIQRPARLHVYLRFLQKK